MAKPEASLFFVENKELDLLGDKPVMVSDINDIIF